MKRQILLPVTHCYYENIVKIRVFQMSFANKYLTYLINSSAYSSVILSASTPAVFFLAWKSSWESFPSMELKDILEGAINLFMTGSLATAAVLLNEWRQWSY